MMSNERQGYIKYCREENPFLKNSNLITAIIVSVMVTSCIIIIIIIVIDVLLVMIIIICVIIILLRLNQDHRIQSMTFKFNLLKGLLGIGEQDLQLGRHRGHLRGF